MSTELTWGGATTTNERNLALLAHLSTFIFPVFAPLILWAIKKDDSAYVGYHALQATVFQLIATMLAGMTFGIGLLLFILPIVWAMKANRGEWVGYPLIESIGR